MRAEGLDEIRRAIHDVRFPDRKRNLRQHWNRILSRGRPATPAPTDRLVKVHGYVPRAFLAWIRHPTAQGRAERVMLNRCYLQEVPRQDDCTPPAHPTPTSRS
jgi:hypothetical protein